VSDNRNRRQMAERMALNAPIQGTAADVIKLAMIQLQRALDRSGLRAQQLLQVHDEVILEVPDDEVEAAGDLVVDSCPRWWSCRCRSRSTSPPA
jgi:DNA polymerase I